jgi:hypothetical protein
VPECAGFVPELYCQRKFGLRPLEKLEDAFRRSKQRIELESEALDERYAARIVSSSAAFGADRRISFLPAALSSPRPIA